MTLTRRFCVLLTAILLCAACGAREDGAADLPPEDPPPSAADPAPADPAAPGDPQPAPTPSQRRATREDTVMIEGMAEVETSRLLTSPSGFVLPFSTYVPEGMESQVAPPSAVRFIAAFAGNPNEDAFMVVHIQDAGAPRRPVETILSDLMQTRSAQEHESVAIERPSWVVDATGFRAIAADGTNVTGSVVVGEHGGRYFHVIRYYPVEYGDGLPPRLHTILRHWRWEDTGEMLMR